MDPREASMIVAARRDMSPVTIGTWLDESRALSQTLAPGEWVHMAAFSGEFGPVAVTDAGLRAHYRQPKGRPVLWSEIAEGRPGDGTVAFTTISGERIEVAVPSEDVANQLLQVAGQLRQRFQPGAITDATAAGGFPLWDPTPEQRRAALLRSVLKPVPLIGLIIVAAFIAALVRLLVVEALGFDWFQPLAIPLWILLSVSFALLGVRAVRRDRLRQFMHAEALSVLERQRQRASALASPLPGGRAG